MKQLIVTIAIPEGVNIDAFRSFIEYTITHNTLQGTTVLSTEVVEHDPEYYGINSDALEYEKGICCDEDEADYHKYMTQKFNDSQDDEYAMEFNTEW